MTRVTLTLPAWLLRQFRELAGLCTVTLRPESQEERQARFDYALKLAVAEAMLVHADMEPVPAHWPTRGPVMAVHANVPAEAQAFVAELARFSGLTLETTWHLVVLEFVERTESPGLELERAMAA